ncbi:MAG TPA: hypothetical protein PLX20_01180 [Rhodocyclaceae bacterium]|nr:hypothetical protein [Rhodocyclaceae bacterium]HMZ83909.1 hypothetical protein [Rhodocyclaceae bacterium]HNA03580.1 hypothetical protein [Rhodocyclaceae bacterium]HNB77664.1 hypothetical protein [Rhodocyclaceae bacterium]HNC61471.1 hypothetical protein [Rhodocyclaceae bacterium]
MQHVFLAALLALAVSAPASADVGISVRIGQPGYYGRIDIGDYPSPMLVYPDPVVIVPPPGAVRGPLYLRVPPGHMHDWRRHCHRYSACGRPVYFVQDNWYTDVYAPHYRERHVAPPPRYAPPPVRRHDHDRIDPRYDPGYRNGPPRGYDVPGRGMPPHGTYPPGAPGHVYGPGRGPWRD